MNLLLFIQAYSIGNPTSGFEVPKHVRVVRGAFVGHLNALNKTRLKLLTKVATKVEIVIILKWISKICDDVDWKPLEGVHLSVGVGDAAPMQGPGIKGFPLEHKARLSSRLEECLTPFVRRFTTFRKALNESKKYMYSSASLEQTTFLYSLEEDMCTNPAKYKFQGGRDAARVILVAPDIKELMAPWGKANWDQEFYKGAISAALPGIMDLSLKPECQECVNVSNHKLMEDIEPSEKRLKMAGLAVTILSKEQWEAAVKKSKETGGPEKADGLLA